MRCGETFDDMSHEHLCGELNDGHELHRCSCGITWNIVGFVRRLELNRATASLIVGALNVADENGVYGMPPEEQSKFTDEELYKLSRDLDNALFELFPDLRAMRR